MDTKQQIEEALEITIGFMRPAELQGQGNFYLFGAVEADIEWADGEKQRAQLLGRVKITEARKSFKHLLGIKSKVKEIAEIVDQDKIDNLITDMTLGVQKATLAKKLWGRELKTLSLCSKKTAGTAS